MELQPGFLQPTDPKQLQHWLTTIHRHIDYQDLDIYFHSSQKQAVYCDEPGHTEAAIDFARLAGMKPAGVIVEIMNEDGTMARLPQLLEVAEKFNLRLVSIEDLVSYRMQHDSLILKRMQTQKFKRVMGNSDYVPTNKPPTVRFM